jgi:hypothetical protein
VRRGQDPAAALWPGGVHKGHNPHFHDDDQRGFESARGQLACEEKPSFFTGTHMGRREQISAILPVQDLLLSGRPWLWPHCYLELTITYCCGETASIHPAISGHASFDNMKIIRWDSSAHDPKILQIFRRKAIQHDNIVRAMPLLAIEMQVVVVVTAAGFSNTARTSCGRGFTPTTSRNNHTSGV